MINFCQHQLISAKFMSDVHIIIDSTYIKYQD